MRRQRYAPHGILALAPQAFGLVFDVAEPSARTVDDVAIVDVRGPLEHHAGWCFDSYDAIKSRVASAIEQRPRAIVLSIDSPGGVVSGCFDTAREIRAMAEEAGVPLYAYVDGQATSAAYALACAAERIYVPETGFVGSIGVIDALVDATAQDAMFGVRFSLVASGARKTDGNPHTVTSEDALSAAQKRVNGLAEVFFAHVSESRKLDVDDIRAMQAGVFHGAEAVARGLADEIATFDEVLAQVASGTVASAERMTGEQVMADTDYEDGVAKLRKAAEGDDENAKMARKMLAAMEDDSDAAEAEGDDDSEPPPSKDDDESASAEEDDDKEEAKASAASTAIRLSARVASLEAKLAAKEEAEERGKLLASRPDLPVETVEWLKTEPLAVVKKAIAKIPQGVARRAASTAVVGATRGQGQGDGSASRLAPEAKADLDRRMGLVATKPGIVEDGNKLVLGAPVPVTGKGA